MFICPICGEVKKVIKYIGNYKYTYLAANFEKDDIPLPIDMEDSNSNISNEHIYYCNNCEELLEWKGNFELPKIRKLENRFKGLNEEETYKLSKIKTEPIKEVIPNNFNLHGTIYTDRTMIQKIKFVYGSGKFQNRPDDHDHERVTGFKKHINETLEKKIRISQVTANSITDYNKASRRAICFSDAGYEKEIVEVYLDRAIELYKIAHPLNDKNFGATISAYGDVIIQRGD
jgi:hypothetical protein